MAEVPARAVALTAVGIAFASGFAFSGVTISSPVLSVLLLPGPATPLPTKEDPSKEPVSKKPVTTSSHLARQWAKLFDIGKKKGPLTIVVSVVCYVGAAISLPKDFRGRETRIKLLAAATLLDLLVFPFTLTFMHPTNLQLISRAQQAESPIGDDIDQTLGTVTQESPYVRTEDLIRRWGKMNLARTAFPFLGIAIAVAAIAS